MQWERIKPYDHIVVSVAAEYAKKFEMCELEDIKQVLYIWFVKHPNKLDNWEAIGPKDAKNLIYRSLRNEALDYCQYWKSKSLGYEVQDLFYYTPEMIENLLPAVLRDDVGALPVITLGTIHGSSTPAESGNLATMMAEISKGYNRLNEDDKKVLFMRFALSAGFDEIKTAMALGTEDASRMRVKRAIKHLIVKSGGYRPKPDQEDDPALDGEGSITPPESEVTPEL